MRCRSQYALARLLPHFWMFWVSASQGDQAMSGSGRGEVRSCDATRCTAFHPRRLTSICSGVQMSRSILFTACQSAPSRFSSLLLSSPRMAGLTLGDVGAHGAVHPRAADTHEHAAAVNFPHCFRPAHRFQEAQRASNVSKVAWCRRTILAAICTALVVRLLDEVAQDAGVAVRRSFICALALLLRLSYLA